MPGGESTYRRERILRFIPGFSVESRAGAAAVVTVFFYLYSVTTLIRILALADAGAFGFVLFGWVSLYVASVFPVLARSRPWGRRYGAAARRYRRNVMAVVGLVIVLFFFGAALLAPGLTPYEPFAQQPTTDRYEKPSADHPMGTDKFGRDIMSRVLYGARLSLTVAVFAVLLAALLGTAFGAVSGYFGGWIDDAFMRMADGLLAFPRLLLVLTLVAFFSNSIALLIIVIALTGWMGVARLVRGEVLRLKEREFIDAAVATGAGRFRIIWNHLLPNAIGPVIIAATLKIGSVILLESYLSFLGLGVQPPDPSWGSMVFDGRDVLISAWWVSAFPGLAIVVTVVGCNLLGDGLRDAMDVKGSA